MISQLLERIGSIGLLGTALLGGAMIVLSLFTFYALRRRAFHRRNQLGVEMFRSYAHMIWTRNLEYFIRLIAFGGLVAGGLIIAIGVIYR